MEKKMVPISINNIVPISREECINRKLKTQGDANNSQKLTIRQLKFVVKDYDSRRKLEHSAMNSEIIT